MPHELIDFALFANLRAQGIYRVRLEYENNPHSNAAWVVSATDVVRLSRDTEEALGYGSHFKPLLTRWGRTFLNQQVPNWTSGPDGSFGSISVLTESLDIELAHTERIMTTRTTNRRFNLQENTINEIL